MVNDKARTLSGGTIVFPGAISTIRNFRGNNNRLVRVACGFVVTPVVFVGNVALVDDQIGICWDAYGGERGGSTGVHYYTSLRVGRRRPFSTEGQRNVRPDIRDDL